MTHEQALKLKVGDTVRCPADRGEPGYSGKVEHIDDNDATHALVKEPFRWVTVRKPGAHASVWPSNRLH